MSQLADQRNSSSFALIGGLAIILSACAHAQMPTPPSDADFQAELPAVWVEQLTFAYNDFRTFPTMAENLTCFTVRAFREGDLYVVEFSPPLGFKKDGDRFDIRAGGSTACGRGMRYEFDSSGRFVRRIGQR